MTLERLKGAPASRPLPAVRERRRPLARSLRDWAAAWAFILPALAIYVLIVVVPTVQSAWYSLWNWDGVSAASWVGLGNYLGFLQDPTAIEALGHTGILLLFFSVIPIVLGLLSAALLSRGRLRGEGIFRWVIFLPQVLPSVVIAVTWKQLYGPGGPVNTALQDVGLGWLQQDWLGSFTLALPALGLVGTWTTFGLCMLLFVSGAMAIPEELYDAARVDGAGAVREFFAVTLPGLVPQLGVALTLTIIGALRAFDLIWLTTRGGPGTSTQTPAIILYSQAFVQQNVGAAAAIGVLMAVASLIVALVIARFTGEGAR